MHQLTIPSTFSTHWDTQSVVSGSRSHPLLEQNHVIMPILLSGQGRTTVSPTGVRGHHTSLLSTPGQNLGGESVGPGRLLVGCKVAASVVGDCVVGLAVVVVVAKEKYFIVNFQSYVIFLIKKDMGEMKLLNTDVSHSTT